MIDRRTSLQAAMVFIVAATVFLSSPVYIFTDSNFALLLGHNILRHGHVRLDEYLARPIDSRLTRDRPPAVGAEGDISRLYQLNTIDGHIYYFPPVGSSILSIPFIPLLNAAGLSPVRGDGGYDRDNELAMQRLLAAVLMGVAASVLFVTSRLVLPTGWSLIATAAVAFGTQVWSTASRVLWSHTWGVLLLVIVIFLLVANARQRRRLNPMLLATILAWLYFVRPVYAMSVATISLYVLVFAYDRKAVVRYALTLALWLALFVAYSYYELGQVLPPYYLQRNFRVRGGFVDLAYRYMSHSAGHFISPSRGLLTYVPTVLFVVYLLTRYWVRVPFPRLAILAFVNIAGFLFMLMPFTMWWGGHSYGPRLLTDIVPWLALLGILGIAAMLAHAPPRTRSIQRLRSRELAVGAVLLTMSIAIHARGALAWETVIWNYFPVDVDERPARLWDWNDPQMLAGAFKPLGPAAAAVDPRRR